MTLLEVTFFTNPWVLALYGWVIYQIIAIRRAKKIIDTNLDGIISFKELNVYMKREFWGLLLSIIALPFGIVYADFVWITLMDTLNKDWPFGEHVYVIMGAVAAIIQLVTNKLLP